MPPGRGAVRQITCKTRIRVQSVRSGPLLVGSATARPRLRPAVPQTHGPVENQLMRRAVEIGAEIALALELNCLSYHGICQGGFYPALGQYLGRAGVEIGKKVASRAGVRTPEEWVVKSNFCRRGMR